MPESFPLPLSLHPKKPEASQPAWQRGHVDEELCCPPRVHLAVCIRRSPDRSVPAPKFLFRKVTAICLQSMNRREQVNREIEPENKSIRNCDADVNRQIGTGFNETANHLVGTDRVTIAMPSKYSRELNSRWLGCMYWKCNVGTLRRIVKPPWLWS